MNVTVSKQELTHTSDKWANYVQPFIRATMPVLGLRIWESLKSWDVLKVQDLYNIQVHNFYRYNRDKYYFTTDLHMICNPVQRELFITTWWSCTKLEISLCIFRNRRKKKKNTIQIYILRFFMIATRAHTIE